LIDTHQCEKKDILFIDFEDVRLQGMSAVQGLTLLKAYYNLYGKEPAFLIFDEIQNIPDWSKLLRTFHNQRYKIIVTGSSSKLLLTEISTELRGRYTHTLILPFSFGEYLTHQEIVPQEIKHTNKS
jgi:predicted AAA+ superfamily ATPase